VKKKAQKISTQFIRLPQPITAYSSAPDNPVDILHFTSSAPGYQQWQEENSKASQNEEVSFFP
jgi:hypothetical protein